ncbi:MAG: endo-1,4-beta-xylanase, partial [Actinomycetia bacterium]|nr:endo-1,4-beta-xylanase [Actinomycetes bacterium]
ARADDYLRLFNATTLPFYLGRFESVRGRPDTARLHAAATWFAERGVHVKGHPLVWHTATPAWLNALPAVQVEQALRDRIRRDVTDFAGVIDCWDAINEAVIMPMFSAEDNGVTRLARERGRIAMVRLAVEEARAANPRATLLLNDFDLGPDYEQLIGDVLDAGIRLDAVGLQTHMHQGFRGAEALWAIADRFARFGLPLHFTETSLVSGHLMPPDIVDLNDYQVDVWPSTPDGEARQAEEISLHYRTLVAHPAVAAIVYWGLSDAHAWLGAPSGLLRADGSRKPSHDVLQRLIKGQWWVGPAEGRTDGEGRLRLTGFRGTYAVTAAGHRRILSLDAGDQTVRQA